MKKTTILVIGILSMLVISGATALKTNIIVQCEDTPGIVIETPKINPVDTTMQFTTIQLPPDIFTDFIVVPAPLTPRFVNYTLNFTIDVVLPSMTANVYTDRKTYGINETITYGIKNTLNYNIGGISVSIQQMVTCNWETLFTYYMPLLLEPGQTYESTWSHDETGWYRIVIDYGYQGGHDTSYAYFTIANIVTTQPFPYLWLNYTIVNNTDGIPLTILDLPINVEPILPIYYLRN